MSKAAPRGSRANVDRDFVGAQASWRHEPDAEDQWALTLAALHWRWQRFSAGPTLLLAGRAGRGGVVATLDRRSLAWAGRSEATAFLRQRRRRP